MGVFLPVHGTDPGHANHGVVFAVLSWPAMAERAINMMEPEDSHLFLSIRQHDGVNHDVELAKLSGKPEFPIERPPPPPEHPSWHTRPIQAFGKTISIRAAPAGHSIQVGAHFGSRTAAGAGILITLVAAMFVRSIENRGHILRREVRRQTMELQKSEAFARSTLDGLSAQIAILGSDGTILAVNRAWQGYAKSGAGLLFSAREGENYLRVCDDSLAAGHAEAGNISAAIRAAIEGTAHPDGIEFHLHARHGDRWLEARVTPFPGAEPARAILAYEDITARRKAEESERKLSSAVEQSPAMVMIIDTRGRIEYANSRFTEVTGYRLEDIRGREIRVVMADDIPADITREIDRAQAEGRVWHGEFQNRRRDGEPFWHRVTISPLRDITGRITHFTAVGEDVTEQRNLENLLLQAQKMETVGRLAGGIAHDFNNLLQIILGSVDFALMDTPPAADIRGDLEEIKRAAEKSAALTRQLLAFARKQTIQPRVLDLNDTISNMTKMLRRLIGDQIQLEFHPGDPVPPVKMDPAQIDQLLANLVVNARDAIQPPGEITISTQAEDLRVGDGERAGDRPAGRYVRMTVRDTGVGMDARTQSRIFEPFFTTKASGVGTGLGLSTVYGIVEQNRGFIRVNSKLGQGTTFDIYIPATAEAAPTDGAAIAITGGHETILLVEDHPQVLKSVQTMLQGLGYTVLATSDPDDARRWAQTQGMAMDLLLSDLVMPNINGRDLAEVIRAHRPDLPCLFMSGYTADIMGADGIMSSKIFFLEKPFTQSALAHKVREALDHPNTHSPSAASSGHPPAGAGGA